MNKSWRTFPRFFHQEGDSSRARQYTAQNQDTGEILMCDDPVVLLQHIAMSLYAHHEEGIGGRPVWTIE